ncbi:MAG: rRNA pseudouridine synthase [Treponema sp.]|nr:rRNA pseudouridine synthase [Treponema sp.]
MNGKVPNSPLEPGKSMRLQVYLAHAGVASRRAAEKLISAGRVSVNGSVVSVLGAKVLPQDEVRIDGLPVHLESRRYYLALHKPEGYLCSAADPQGRPRALELLPKEITERLYTVGRLDYRSSGLILVTNDGAFAAQVGHPSAGIPKEYLVEASGFIPHTVAEEFVRGVLIEGVWYRAEEVERLGKKALRVVLIEGKNREIRRVFSHFHLHPVKLCRIRIGPIRLGDLKPGESRPLTLSEYEALPQRV